MFESLREEPRPEESRGRSPLRGGGGGGGSGDPWPALPEVLPRFTVGEARKTHTRKLFGFTLHQNLFTFQLGLLFTCFTLHQNMLAIQSHVIYLACIPLSLLFM